MLEGADIAEVIVDLPPEDEGIIFRVLPRDSAAQVFSYLPLEQQEQLIKSVSSETSQAILDGERPTIRAPRAAGGNAGRSNAAAAGNLEPRGIEGHAANHELSGA